jgi:ABC-type antimicrobial peptide transport system permease subunit
LSLQGSRVELAVVRVLGFSRRQTTLLLGLEAVLLAGAGLTGGSVAGWLLVDWVLQWVAVDPGGASVLPPLVPTVDGLIAGGTYLMVALAVVTGGVLAFVGVRRLQPALALRLEE